MWKVGKYFVVKGVNKQIVEIIRTENEYFDKAILFVNPDKSAADNKELKEQADLFVDTYIKKEKGFRAVHRRFLRGFLQVACGAAGGALLCALFFMR